MKATSLSFILAAASAAQAQPAQPGSASPLAPVQASVIERGPHHKVWQTITYEPAPGGRTKPKAHSYTELASGLCYQPDGAGAQWADADDSFEITPDGFAIVRRCAHKVIVSPDLNSPEGFVDFLGADGVRLRSTVFGLVLFSRADGHSLQIPIKECQGAQTAPNEITFADAFQGLKASVRVRNERGQFHQEILLHEKITPRQLTRLGFSPDSTRLEIWTEFLQAPTPAIRVANPATDPVANEPDTVDSFLDFGATKFGRGLAFAEPSSSRSALVSKQWLTIDQHQYLVEGCDYSELLPLLDALPESTLASLNPKSSKGLLASSPVRGNTGAPNGLPTRQAPERSKAARKSQFQIAKLGSGTKQLPRSSPSPQVVLDYSALTGMVTNWQFLGDSTTYISSSVTLCLFSLEIM